MRTSRRSLLRGVAGVGLGAALGSASGCGSDTTGRTLSFTYYGDAYAQESWDNGFARFRAQHPEIGLTTKNVAGSSWAVFFNRITTQLAGGQPLDVLQVATEGQLLFASKGLLHPLDEYLRDDPEFAAEYSQDLHPALEKWTSRYASPDGRSYFVATAGNPVCMWYNADLLAEAGVPDPDPDWTWDEFYEICERVHSKTGAYGYSANSAQFAGVLPWLLTNGVNTLDETWTRPTVTDPRAIEAATFVRKLVAEGLSPEPGGTFDEFTAAASGDLAMFGGGRWPILTIRSLKAVEKFRIVPWPRKVSRGSPLGFDGFPILKTSTNKADAWRLVKFLASERTMRTFAEGGGTNVPGRKSVARSPAFLNDSPRGSEYLYEAYDYATPVPSPEQGTAVQRDVEDTWQQILVGNLSPEEGMHLLDENLRASV